MTAFAKGVMSAALFACVTASGAGAQQTGGVKIKGDFTSEVSLHSQTSVARGTHAEVQSRIGSVASGVEVDGDLALHVQGRRVLSYAEGDGQAITSVGTIHEDTHGQKRTVYFDEIVNYAAPGETACFVMGSVGQVPGCDE